MFKLIPWYSWIWELIQNIFGIIILLYFRIRGTTEELQHIDAWYCTSKYMRGGMTLGRFVFLAKGSSEITRMHEYGHVKQSKMLGPLYLLIIGLPSLIHAWIHDSKIHGSYYHFYTEKWADKLMNIER